MRLFALILALLTASIWAHDESARPTVSTGVDDESVEPGMPDWRLDINPCLYTNARCTGTLAIIYDHLQKAKLDPGENNWRLKYWRRRLREYYEFSEDRHD